MRIAVAYDAAADRDASPDTVGVREAVDAVVESLERLGHAAFPVAACRPLDRFASRLDTVDLVFNLVEGLGGRAQDEPRVAALLELSGKPVTGTSSDTLALCLRKDRVNALLAGSAIPVPPWRLRRTGVDLDWTMFPAIVKPAGEDGSVGIDDASVVSDPIELRAALERCPGDAIVQLFLSGRELNVGIVGDTVLPVAEIVFSGAQRVVSYAAKWEPWSAADRNTVAVCPATLTGVMNRQAVELARAAWRAVGGRGYGRIDLRADDAGRLHVLEVNPNPDLAPGAGLARMARARGWDFTALVNAIVREAAR
jgi:D-alanine-D-alanine ligase